MSKVSVIVPVYGVEKYLRQCLDSILSQTHDNIEVIVVDDGGRDSCPAIIDEYAQKDARIVPIHKSNGGYGQACNVGLNRASGDYIAIVEPDDFIESTMLHDLLQLAKKHQADVVKSSYYENYESKIYTGCRKVHWNDELIPVDKKFSIRDNAEFLSFHPSIWSCLYRRDFIEKNKIRFVEAPGAGWTDNPFQVQTLCLADGIVYTPQAYYHYRKFHSNSSKELKDYRIPLERLQEIHQWMDSLSITDSTILRALYKRELVYFRIVLGMENISDLKNCFYLLNNLCQRMKGGGFGGSSFSKGLRFL